MKITKKVTYISDEGFEFNFEPLEDTLEIKKTKGGFEARYLILDQDPQSPREWDNLGTMACFHPDYDLGDKIDFDKPDTIKEFEEYLTKEKGAVIMLPLYLLDHSGISISTGRFSCDAQGWDTSFIGFIYVTKDDLKKEKVTKAKAKSILEGEIKTYDQYISGDCFCIVREDYDKAKKHLDYDVLGGYLGVDWAREALKTEI